MVAKAEGNRKEQAKSDTFNKMVSRSYHILEKPKKMKDTTKRRSRFFKRKEEDKTPRLGTWKRSQR